MHTPTRIYSTLPSRRAFTLIELLTVIAVVAVLAAILIPAMGKVRQSSNAAKSVSNLRQLGQGIELVRSEGVNNAGATPAGYYPPYAGFVLPNWAAYTWYELVGEQLGLVEPVSNQWQWKVHPKDSIFQNPLSEHDFWGEYATLSDVPMSANGRKGKGGYLYNAQIEGWVHATGTPGKRNKPITMTKSPSKLILLGECSDIDGQGGDSVYTGWAGVAPQGNYNDTVRVYFVDGHVDTLSNADLKSSEGVGKYLNPTKF